MSELKKVLQILSCSPDSRGDSRFRVTLEKENGERVVECYNYEELGYIVEGDLVAYREGYVPFGRLHGRYDVVKEQTNE